MEIKDIISSGLLEIYALGMSTSSEAAQVVSWVSQYPDVRDELNAIEVSMEHYALSHSIEPAASIKNELIKKIQTFGRNNKTVSTVKVINISNFWKYAAAASVILFLGSAVLNVVYFTKLEKAGTALQNTKQELLATNDKLETMNADMSVVKNKYSKAVSLDGLPAAPDAAAKIFWMKNTGEVYIDPSNLPEAPEGKQYQLWGIVDGKPVDGGMIVTTKKDNKYRIKKMKTFGKAEAFAVTLETTGGNPTPKGDMYVMGKM